MTGYVFAALAAAEEAGGSLPQLEADTFPSQIVWLLITFFALYAFFSSFALPKIGGVIEERSDRIADDLDKAAELNAQAQEAEREYERALADARAKSSAIAAETRKALDAEIAKMQADTDERLAAKVSEAEARIAAAQENIGEQMKTAAVDVAGALVAQLIDEAPSEDVVRRAVDAARA